MVINGSQKALVSVYITTYKRASALKTAIESVIRQTYPNIEIIIVDDFSEDDTPSVVQSFIDSNENIHFLQNEINSGACFSRNRAIHFAKGTYITGLDDDDTFLPNRIEEFINNFNPKYSFLASNMLYANCGKYISKGYYAGDVSIEKILYDNVIGNQIFIEKEKMISVNGFDEQLTACQDYDLWVRLILKFGSALIIPESTYIVNELDTINRITNSPKAFGGYLKSYKKFKHLMSSKQRARRLFQIFFIQNKNIGFKKSLTFLKHLNTIEFIKLYLKMKYPNLYIKLSALLNKL